MPRIVELLCSRRLPQAAVLALISIAFAGCSADTSSRFSQDPFAGKDPFSNPFSSRSEATGSVPTPQVERHDVPQYNRPQPYQQPYQQQPYQQQPYQSSALPPAVSTPQSYPAASYSAASDGVSGGGRGLASYAPPTQPRLETTGTVPPRSIAAVAPTPPAPVHAVAPAPVHAVPPAPVRAPAPAQIAAAAPAHGGTTTIIVGTSDTLEVIAQRYHVTPAAILAANGYKGPRVLSPGQQLIIPHETTTVLAAPAAALASKPARLTAAAPSVHVVNPGDTLMSIAHRNHISVAELARANNLSATAPLKLGAKLTVPGAKTASAAPFAGAPAPAAVAQPAVAVAPAPVTRVAAAGPAQSARLAQASPTDDEPKAEITPVKAASDATGALPTFRWPVRGKVITSYGAKTNGKSNDGINLAVPEGTPVKAAEDGVVAYAGNELKGYGNLVLVRHANGYVTAYAHASELLVKRGDTIKRGQVIAKSGQSGEVASPQLHFEIRKGSNPVDPLQFLNGA
jgi:murein DD-endopeptidase MepM/ murein hydrolase activator NlpD